MNSRERMMRALHGEKPDRVPVTIHQWQQYHLDNFMEGMDALSAFKATGMEAAVQDFGVTNQVWMPELGWHVIQTPEWREEVEVVDADPWNKVAHHTVVTPEGQLSYKTVGNPTTTWVSEQIIKHHDDIELLGKYLPVGKVDKEAVARQHDAIGEAGILRRGVWGDQAGCWQHACCLVDVNDLILEAHDNPDWVHRLLKILLEKKLRFVEESLKGAKFDLIETGGGAGSDTVISPAMHREFCLPYDREINRAVREAGLLSTYHTCGGMMNILELIEENGTDASETLAPPGTGGNVAEPKKVRESYAGRVAMIGGMDQFHILTNGTPEQIRAEVHRLFEGFGAEGGYLLSTADHFFDTPVENLRAYAEAARECRY